MNKVLKKFGIVLLVIGIAGVGLYASDPMFSFIFSGDRLGFIIDQTCDIAGLEKYDMFDKSCYHAFCCEPMMVYLFYLLLLTPISFFLFSKKQKLPAILFTAFGVGIILGTFVFFLIMP